MKKVLGIIVALICITSIAEYYTITLTGYDQQILDNGNVIALDVLSTDSDADVSVSVVRIVQSYTNCTKIAVVTNGIGEVSTVTNRWMGLKEKVVRTNDLVGVTCTNGVGNATVGKFIFGGDAVIATGINKDGETVKAKLIIEK